MYYIIEEHSPDKDVAYYAQKPGINAQIPDEPDPSISGQSARDWIVYYTIFEIKIIAQGFVFWISRPSPRVRIFRPCDVEPLLPPLYRHDAYEIPRVFF